jgi:phosphate uptake regulator
MWRRKIQLVAGTTYTVSLPKEWIEKNKLKGKKEVVINEGNDRSLVVSPDLFDEKSLNEINLDIDDYLDNIDQVLYAIYYLGVESITIFSKKKLGKDVRISIRKTLNHMSGTEITYEDDKKMTIKVLLDKVKIDIRQILFRIKLILDSSLASVSGKMSMSEVRINEREIDRLYHLITKIISSSLIDSKVLHSSGIGNVSLVPSYFLIGKRLENIGDSCYYLAEHMKKNKVVLNKNKKGILEFVRKELVRSIDYLIGEKKKGFDKISRDEHKEIQKHVSGIQDKVVEGHIGDLVRLIRDLEEEIVNVSFYKGLIREKFL